MLQTLIALQSVVPGMGDESAKEIAEGVDKMAADMAVLKSMSFNDVIAKLTESAVTFAINLAVAALVFYVGRFVIRKIYGLVSTIFQKRHVDRSLTTFVLSVINITLYFVLLVTVIGILGIETSSFLALFASAGVAIGMALSGTLQNFAGGVLIMLLKPYKIGDYIEVQGYSGTVKEIQIFSTVITTSDNKSISIPNGGLSTGSVNNWTREAYRRVSWTVSVSYGDDVDVAREAILEMLHSDERVMSGIEGELDFTPKVFVGELAASSVDLHVRAWTKTSDYWGVFYAMNELFYKELPKKGLSFPFPQLDVHTVAN